MLDLKYNEEKCNNKDSSNFKVPQYQRSAIIHACVPLRLTYTRLSFTGLIYTTQCYTTQQHDAPPQLNPHPIIYVLPLHITTPSLMLSLNPLPLVPPRPPCNPSTAAATVHTVKITPERFCLSTDV